MTSHQPNNVISMDFGVLFSLEAAKGFHHRFALKGPNNHHYLIDVSPGVHEDNLKISYVEASHSKPESIEVSVAQLRQEGSFICDDTASKLAACRNFVIKLLTENFCSHEISLPETSLEDELIVSPCFGIVSFLHHFIVPATACPIRSVCIANVVSQHHRFALKAPLHHYIVDILEDWKEDKLLLRYMNPIAAHVSNYEISSSQMSEAGIDNVHTANAPKKIEACKQILLAYLQLQESQLVLEEATLHNSLVCEVDDLSTIKTQSCSDDFSVVLIASVGPVSMVSHVASSAIALEFGIFCPLEMPRGFHHRFALKLPNNHHYVVDIFQGTPQDSLKISFMDLTESLKRSTELSIEELQQSVWFVCDDTASKVAACREHVLKLLSESDAKEELLLSEPSFEKELVIVSCLGPVSSLFHLVNTSSVCPVAFLPVANVISQHHRFVVKTPLHHYIVDMLEDWREDKLLLRYMDPISSRASSYEVSSSQLRVAGIQDASSATPAQKIEACKQILLAYLTMDKSGFQLECILKVIDKRYLVTACEAPAGCFFMTYTEPLSSCVKNILVTAEERQFLGVEDWSSCNRESIKEACHIMLMNVRMSELMLMWRGVVPVGSCRLLVQLIESAEASQDAEAYGTFYITTKWFDPLSGRSGELKVFDIDFREQGYLCDLLLVPSMVKIDTCISKLAEHALWEQIHMHQSDTESASERGSLFKDAPDLVVDKGRFVPVDFSVVLVASVGTISMVNHHISAATPMDFGGTCPLEIARGFHQRIALKAPNNDHYVVDISEGSRENSIKISFMDATHCHCESIDLTIEELKDIVNINCDDTASKVAACRKYVLWVLARNENTEASPLYDSDLRTEMCVAPCLGPISFANHFIHASRVLSLAHIPVANLVSYHHRFALKAPLNYYVVDMLENWKEANILLRYIDPISSRLSSYEISSLEMLEAGIHDVSTANTAQKVGACKQILLAYLKGNQRSDLEEASVHGSLGGEVAELENEENSLISDDFSVVLISSVGVVSMINHQASTATIMDFGELSPLEIARGFHRRIALKAPNNHHYVVDISEGTKENSLHICFMRTAQSQVESVVLSIDELRESGRFLCDDTASKVAACREYVLCLLARKEHKEDPPLSDSGLDIEVFVASSLGPISSVNHFIHPTRVLSLSNVSVANVISYHHRFALNAPLHYYIVDMLEHWKETNILLRYIDPISSRLSSYEVSSLEMHEAGIPDVSAVSTAQKVDACKQILLAYLKCNEHSDLEEASVHGFMAGEAAELENEESSLITEDFSVVLIASVGVVSMVNNQPSTATTVDFGDLSPLEIARAFHRRIALKASNNHHYVVDISEGTRVDSLQINFTETTQSQMESVELSTDELQDFVHFLCDDTASKVAACREYVLWHLARSNKEEPELTYDNLDGGKNVTPCLGPISYLNHFICPARVFSLARVSVANIVSQHHRFALKAPLNYYIVDMLENWKEANIMLRYIDPISSRLKSYEVSSLEMREAGISDISTVNTAQKVDACKQILLAYLKNERCFGASAFQLKCILKVIDKRYLVSACEASDGGFFIKYTDPLRTCLKQHLVHAEEKQVLGISGWSASERDSIKEACHVLLMNIRMSELMLVWRGVVPVGGRRLLVQLIESSEPSQDVQGAFYITTKWYDPLSRGSGQLQVFDKEFRELGYLCDLLLVPSPGKIETCISKLNEQALWQQLQECHSDLEEASVHGSLGGESAALEIEESSVFAEDFSVVLIASVGVVSMVNHQTNTATVVDFGQLLSLEMARGFHHRLALKAQNNQYYVVDISEGESEASLKISYMGATKSELESTELSIKELQESGNFSCHDTASKIAACCEHVRKLLARNEPIDKASLCDSDSEAEVFVAPCLGPVSLLNHFMNPARVISFFHLSVANVISQHHRFALKAPRHYYIVDMLENWKEGEILLRYTDPISSRLSGYEVSFSQMTEAGIDDVSSANASQKVEACKQILLAYLKGFNCFGGSAFQLKCVLKVIDKRFLVSACEASDGGFSIKYTDALTSCLKQIFVHAEEKKFLGVDGWSACEMDSIKEACHVVLMNARMSELMLVWRGVVLVGGRRLLVQLNESAQPSQDAQGTFYITTKWYDPLSRGSGELQVFDKEFRVLGYLCDLLLVPSQVKIEACVSKLVEQELWKQLQGCRSDLEEASLQSSLDGESAELYTEERLPLAEDFHVVLIASVGAISMVNHLASTTTIMDFGELSLLEIAREFHHRFAVKAPDNQHYIVDISEGTRKDCLKISFMGTTQSQLESMELSIDELRESENFVCDDTASKVCACREYVLKLLARNQHIEKPSLPDSDSEATLFAAPSFGALSFLNYYINLARSVPLPSLAVANVISRHHRFALKAPLHYYIVDMLENQEEGEILLRYMDPISSRLSSYEVSSLQLSAAGINDICSADAVQKVDACKQILLAYLKGDHRFGARAFQVKCILKVIDKRYLVSAYEASAGGFSIKYTDPLSSCIKHISVCAEQKKLLGVDAWSACEGDCIKEACLVILMNARMSELMLMWRGVVPVGGRRLLVQLIESSEPIQGMQGTFYITLKWYDPLSCGSGELQVFDQDFRELGYLCDLLLVPIPVKIETCTSKLVEQQLWQQLQVVHSDLDEVSVHGSLCGELAELGIVGSSHPSEDFSVVLIASVGEVSMGSHQVSTAAVLDFQQSWPLKKASGFHHRFALKAPNNLHYVVDISEGIREDSLKITFMGTTHSHLESAELSLEELRESGSAVCVDTLSKISACREHVLKLLTNTLNTPEPSLSDSEVELFVALCVGPVSSLCHNARPASVLSLPHLSVANVMSQHNRFVLKAPRHYYIVDMLENWKEGVILLRYIHPISSRLSSYEVSSLQMSGAGIDDVRSADDGQKVEACKQILLAFLKGDDCFGASEFQLKCILKVIDKRYLVSACEASDGGFCLNYTDPLSASLKHILVHAEEKKLLGVEDWSASERDSIKEACHVMLMNIRMSELMLVWRGVVFVGGRRLLVQLIESAEPSQDVQGAFCITTKWYDPLSRDYGQLQVFDTEFKKLGFACDLLLVPSPVKIETCISKLVEQGMWQQLQEWHSDLEVASVHGSSSGTVAESGIDISGPFSDDFSVVLIASVGVVSMLNHQTSTATILDFGELSPLEMTSAFHHRLAVKASDNHHYVIDISEGIRKNILKISFMGTTQSHLESMELSIDQLRESGNLVCDDTASKIAACRVHVLKLLARSQNTQDASLADSDSEAELFAAACIGPVSSLNHHGNLARFVSLPHFSVANVISQHHRFALKASLHYYIVDLLDNWNEANILLRYMDPISSRLSNYQVSSLQLRCAGIDDVLSADASQKVEACKQILLAFLKDEHRLGVSAFQLKCILKVVDKRYLVSACEASDGGFSLKYTDPLSSDLKQITVHAEQKKLLGVHGWSASKRDSIQEACHAILINTRMLELMLVWRGVVSVVGRRLLVQLIESAEPSQGVQGTFYITSKWYDPLSRGSGELQVFDTEFRELGYMCDLLLIPSSVKIETCISKLVEQELWRQLQRRHLFLEEVSVFGSLISETTYLRIEDSSLNSEEFSVVLIASVGVVSMVNHQPGAATVIDFGQSSPLEITRGFHHRLAVKAPNNVLYVVDIFGGIKEDSFKISFMGTTQSQLESVELSIDELRKSENFVCDDTASKIAACRDYVMKLLAKYAKVEALQTDSNMEAELFSSRCLGPVSSMNHFTDSARVISLPCLSVANVIALHHRFALKAPPHHYIVDMLENLEVGDILLRYMDSISSRLSSYKVSSSQISGTGIDVCSADSSQKVEACKHILLAYLTDRQSSVAHAFQLKCILKVIDKRYLVNACAASEGGFCIKYTDPLNSCLNEVMVRAEEAQLLGVNDWIVSKRDSIKDACHVTLMNFRMSELMLVWRGVAPIGGRRLLVQLMESAEPSQDKQGTFYITTKWYDPLSRDSGELQIFDTEFRELGYMCDLLFVPFLIKRETCISRLTEQALFRQLQVCHSDLAEVSPQGSQDAQSCKMAIDESFSVAEDFSVVLIASVGNVSMCNYYTSTASAVNFGQLRPLERVQGFLHKFTVKSSSHKLYAVHISEGMAQDCLKLTLMHVTQVLWESTEVSIEELQQSRTFVWNDAASKISACREYVLKILNEKESQTDVSMSEVEREEALIVVPALGAVSVQQHCTHFATIIPLSVVSVANVISHHARFALKAPLHYYIVDMLEDWKEDKLLLRYLDPISSRLSGYEVSLSQMAEAGIHDVCSADAAQKVDACKQILLAYLQSVTDGEGSSRNGSRQFKFILKVIDRRFLVHALGTPGGGFSIKYLDPLTSCSKDCFVQGEELSLLGVDGWVSCNSDCIREACHVVLMNIRMSELMLVWRGVVPVGGHRFLVQLIESLEPSENETSQGAFYITSKWHDPLSRSFGELQIFDKDFKDLGYKCDLLLIPSFVKIDTCISKLAEKALWQQLQEWHLDLEGVSTHGSVAGTDSELVSKESISLSEDFSVVLIASVGIVSRLSHQVSSVVAVNICQFAKAREFHHRLALKVPNNRHYLLDISNGVAQDNLKISFLNATQCQWESIELSLEELQQNGRFVCDDTASKVAACREHVLKLLTKDVFAEPLLSGDDFEEQLAVTCSSGTISSLSHHISPSASFFVAHLPPANVISQHRRFALKAFRHHYIVDMLEEWKEDKILLRYIEPVSSRLRAYEVTASQMSEAGIHDIGSADATQKVEACKQILLTFLLGSPYQLKCILKAIDRRYLVSACEIAAGVFSIKYTDPLNSCFRKMIVPIEEMELLGVDFLSVKRESLEDACHVMLMNVRMSELIVLWRGIVSIGGRRLFVQLTESAEPNQEVDSLGAFYITAKWYDPLSRSSGEMKVFDTDFMELGYVCDLLLVPTLVKKEKCISKLAEQALLQHLQEFHLNSEKSGRRGSLDGTAADLEIQENVPFSEDFTLVLNSFVGPVSMASHHAHCTVAVNFGPLYPLNAEKTSQRLKFILKAIDTRYLINACLDPSHGLMITLIDPVHSSIEHIKLNAVEIKDISTEIITSPNRRNVLELCHLLLMNVRMSQLLLLWRGVVLIAHHRLLLQLTESAEPCQDVGMEGCSFISAKWYDPVRRGSGELKIFDTDFKLLGFECDLLLVPSLVKINTCVAKLSAQALWLTLQECRVGLNDASRASQFDVASVQHQPTLKNQDFSVVLVASVGNVSVINHQVAGIAVMDFGLLIPLPCVIGFHQKCALKSKDNHHYVLDVSIGLVDGLVQVSWMDASQSQLHSLDVNHKELVRFGYSSDKDMSAVIDACRGIVLEKLHSNLSEKDLQLLCSLEEVLLSVDSVGPISSRTHLTEEARCIKVTPLNKANVISQHHRFDLNTNSHLYIVNMLEDWNKGTLLLRYMDPFHSRINGYEVCSNQMNEAGIANANSADTAAKVEACKKILLAFLKKDTSSKVQYRFKFVVKAIDTRYLVDLVVIPSVGGFSVKYIDPLYSSVESLVLSAEEMTLYGVEAFSSATEIDSLKDVCYMLLMNARLSQLLLVWRGVMLVGTRRMLVQLLETDEPSQEVDTQGAFYISVKWYDPLSQGFGALKVYDIDFKMLGYSCELLLVPDFVKIETCAAKLSEKALWQNLHQCHSNLQEASPQGITDSVLVTPQGGLKKESNFSIVLVASVGMISLTSHHAASVVSLDLKPFPGLVKGFHQRFVLRLAGHCHYVVDISQESFEENLKIKYMDVVQSFGSSFEISVVELQQITGIRCDDAPSRVSACHRMILSKLGLDQIIWQRIP